MQSIGKLLAGAMATVALVGCSTPEPVMPTPTLAPVTTSPAPTSKPEPTATVTSEPTLEPAAMLLVESKPEAHAANLQTAEPKLGDLERLTALVASSDNADLWQFVDSLSESERTCVAAGSGPDAIARYSSLRTFLEYGSVTPVEMIGLLRCLDDDSVTTLTIMGMSVGLGPLSEATNICISSGLTGIDLRNVLTGVDEGALMVHGMVSHVIVLSCLNDSEWQNADRVMTVDIVPEDQERLNCIVEYFGGAHELATALRPTTEYLPEAFF